MKLIINGDDFGLTLGVSKGIIEAIKNGEMTDTTAMANMPKFEESIQLAKDSEINEMGVHLTLSCGMPLTGAKSLLDDNGVMSKKVYKQGTYEVNDIENEFRAQIEKFLATGMKLNHIDGHHHLYAAVPAALQIALKLAKEYKVPMRCPFDRDLPFFKSENVKCPNHMVADFFEETATEEHLKQVILDAKNKGLEVLEVMSHPAYVDEELINISSYQEHRMKELKILTSDSFKKFILENNIEMISFSSL